MLKLHSTPFKPEHKPTQEQPEMYKNEDNSLVALSRMVVLCDRCQENVVIDKIDEVQFRNYLCLVFYEQLMRINNKISLTFSCVLITHLINHGQSLINLRGETRWACLETLQLYDLVFFLGNLEILPLPQSLIACLSSSSETLL